MKTGWGKKPKRSREEVMRLILDKRISFDTNILQEKFARWRANFLIKIEHKISPESIEHKILFKNNEFGPYDNLSFDFDMSFNKIDFIYFFLVTFGFLSLTKLSFDMLKGRGRLLEKTSFKFFALSCAGLVCLEFFNNNSKIAV